MFTAKQGFWKLKRLDQLSLEEWESLCDGCGQCCLLKLEDSDTGELYYTDVACKLLDVGSCRCKDYERRKQVVPDCIVLNADTVGDYPFLPTTCAYRRLYEGKDLPAWHPLVTGNPESVHRAGMSVRGRAVSEQYIHPEDLKKRIIPTP